MSASKDDYPTLYPSTIPDHDPEETNRCAAAYALFMNVEYDGEFSFDSDEKESVHLPGPELIFDPENKKWLYFAWGCTADGCDETRYYGVCNNTSHVPGLMPDFTVTIFNLLFHSTCPAHRDIEEHRRLSKLATNEFWDYLYDRDLHVIDGRADALRHELLKWERIKTESE